MVIITPNARQYKVFGKGDPIILFNGASDNMDAWDPSF